MLSVNNTSKLEYLLKFDEGHSFYSFLAIVRLKDYKEANQHILESGVREGIVKTWRVDSQKSLDDQIMEMLFTIEAYKCRLYLSLDKKSYLKMLLEARRELDKTLEQALFKGSDYKFPLNSGKVLNHAEMVDTSSEHNNRYWLLDLDTKDKKWISFMDKNIAPSLLVRLSTKNGYHYICPRNCSGRVLYQFLLDRKDELGVTEAQFRKTLELKENALTLIAMAE